VALEQVTAAAEARGEGEAAAVGAVHTLDTQVEGEAQLEEVQVLVGAAQAALEVLPAAEVCPEGQAVHELAPLPE
jgi:hypothetical protein